MPLELFGRWSSIAYKDLNPTVTMYSGRRWTRMDGRQCMVGEGKVRVRVLGQGRGRRLPCLAGRGWFGLLSRWWIGGRWQCHDINASLIPFGFRKTVSSVPFYYSFLAKRACWRGFWSEPLVHVRANWLISWVLLRTEQLQWQYPTCCY
jgi:hypothetical protein